jgi:hypothetical protein
MHRIANPFSPVRLRVAPPATLIRRLEARCAAIACTCCTTYDAAARCGGREQPGVGQQPRRLLIEVPASSALSGEQVATLIAAGRTLLSDIPQSTLCSPVSTGHRRP